MFRISKCCSRCGDKAGAVAGLEKLLYNYNFWDERYRFAGLTLFRGATFSALDVSEHRGDSDNSVMFALDVH